MVTVQLKGKKYVIISAIYSFYVLKTIIVLTFGLELKIKIFLNHYSH